ncbi:hypothetical protein NPIL_401201 [Nephila pilipes]|uniref:Uncharacterized protein n=1 Tax=Nephila pilipes TaxID=299642 RepID=A0A8X6IJP3_NEPPI|nr:hypothetical protein NPIL_401201 [Nephila pilipes]
MRGPPSLSPSFFLLLKGMSQILKVFTKRQNKQQSGERISLAIHGYNINNLESVTSPEFHHSVSFKYLARAKDSGSKFTPGRSAKCFH